MSDYYTQTGDDGTTGMLGSDRVSKDHPRIEAVGAIDEANAALGFVRAISEDTRTKEVIIAIQRDLYKLMAEVSATPTNAARFQAIDASKVAWLEEQVETFGQRIQMPKEFIVPGDTKTGAVLDLARTIIRRAERRVTSLYQEGDIANKELLRYLNRLSSLCFILELWENHILNKSTISFAKES
jgi:cob(I)alamin adenosyltransferase